MSVAVLTTSWLPVRGCRTCELDGRMCMSCVDIEFSFLEEEMGVLLVADKARQEMEDDEMAKEPNLKQKRKEAITRTRRIGRKYK